MRLVRRLHEEILETSDVKILESAIQNQSALTAKTVVETLRGDGSFSESSTGEGMTCTCLSRSQYNGDLINKHLNNRNN